MTPDEARTYWLSHSFSHPLGSVPETVIQWHMDYFQQQAAIEADGIPFYDGSMPDDEPFRDRSGFWGI